MGCSRGKYNEPRLRHEEHRRQRGSKAASVSQPLLAIELEANSVGGNDVGVIGTEDNFDVLEGSVALQSSVFTELLLKDWEVLAKRGGREVHRLVVPEVSHSLSVQVNVTKVRPGNVVGNAGCSGLGDHELRHG